METTTFRRKPFDVEAVQVTDENMVAVASWCQGEVRDDEKSANVSVQYIKVRVHNPLNERQTKAYIGDWVLYAGKGYKIYTDKAFKAGFDELVEQSTPQSLVESAPTFA